VSRHRYVIRNGELVELDLDAPLPPRVAPYIQGDIASYRSVITREPITSRSQHREHLRAHGAFEVGNEYPKAMKRQALSVREDIARALEASPEIHAEARAASERAAKVPIGEGLL